MHSAVKKTGMLIELDLIGSRRVLFVPPVRGSFTSNFPIVTPLPSNYSIELGFIRIRFLSENNRRETSPGCAVGNAETEQT